MGTDVRRINESASTQSADELLWTSTEPPLTPEEEDAIITLVVVVIGVIAAIIILFSMGIFIDCKHQKKETVKKRKLKLKMPPLARARRAHRDDVKSLASDMCPNGATDSTFQRDAIV